MPGQEQCLGNFAHLPTHTQQALMGTRPTCFLPAGHSEFLQNGYSECINQPTRLQALATHVQYEEDMQGINPSGPPEIGGGGDATQHASLIPNPLSQDQKPGSGSEQLFPNNPQSSQQDIPIYFLFVLVLKFDL